MSKRKRMSEFGLNMQVGHQAICRLSELDYITNLNYFNNDNPCHIYFIGSRPKITIDKDGFKFDENIFTIRLLAQIEDKHEWLELDYENIDRSKDLKFVTSFPYFSFKLYDGERLLLHSNGLQLMQNVGMENRTPFYENLDFKVLYIGQSYGIEGARTAPDRLKSHSTMQEIFEDANRNNPDKDIILGLFTFKKWLIASFDGRMKLNKEEKEEDSKHIDNVTFNVLEKGINEQQEINFTEAALIRYFQPKYNDKLKYSFPNPAHTSYSECYELDINSISLEFISEPLLCRFYSDHVNPEWWHMPQFNLHNSLERKSMFEL